MKCAYCGGGESGMYPPPGGVALPGGRAAHGPCRAEWTRRRGSGLCVRCGAAPGSVLCEPCADSEAPYRGYPPDTAFAPPAVAVRDNGEPGGHAP